MFGGLIRYPQVLGWRILGHHQRHPATSSNRLAQTNLARLYNAAFSLLRRLRSEVFMFFYFQSVLSPKWYFKHKCQFPFSFFLCHPWQFSPSWACRALWKAWNSSESPSTWHLSIAMDDLSINISGIAPAAARTVAAVSKIAGSTASGKVSNDQNICWLKIANDG